MPNFLKKFLISVVAFYTKCIITDVKSQMFQS